MTGSTAQTFQVNLRRTFAAPPERVFDAWTKADALMKWWGAGPDMEAAGAEVDLRVGGKYRLSMRHKKEDKVHTCYGRYREVDRPHKLVYTWQWEGSDAMDSETLVTVEFKPSGDGTEVVFTHELLPTEDLRAAHEHGWNGCLDNLERFLG